MFEANAIRFGMDQMLDASSEQLSSFIHWYFWCVNIGPLLTYYIVICFSYQSFECLIEIDQLNYTADHTVGRFALLSSFHIITSFCVILFICVTKRCFTIQKTTRNPLKIVLRILAYSFKHKFPERRSSLTYWENSIPSCIDLGKDKYGGPFTYEQVEDVKTMFRLLLLMASLFGFYLSGDGYSLTNYIMNTMGCPTLLPSVMLIWNPENVTVLSAVLAIPIYQCLKKYLSRYTPTLMNRLWLGLFICLVSECIQCNYALFSHNSQFQCPELHLYMSEKPSLVLQCIVAHIKVVNNGSCEHICSTLPVNDPLAYLSAIPLAMNGISYLLVFVTTVEFISAQSPNAMKGLLIGIWYSMLAIKYSLVNNLDIHPFLLEEDNWNIYHGIKGFCIFLSILCFSLVCKNYQYRQKNEIVNEQAMIEEQYERELLLNSSSVMEEHR